MYDQSGRGPIFPATCARCGGRVSGPVSFCPNCGAPAQLAFGNHEPAKTPGAAGGRNDVPHDKPQWRRPASSYASNDSVYPYDEIRPPSPASTHRPRSVKKSAMLTLLAAVVLVGGAVGLRWYNHADTREPQLTSGSAQGIVSSNGLSNPTQAPATPEAPAIAQSPEATQGAITPPGPQNAQNAQNEEAPSPAPALSDKGHDDKHHKLISLALARAHGGLEKNDLRMARSGVYWALSLEPDNREALVLKQDLISRERARDAALKAARSCVVQDQRQCAWQNANSALAIDSSSTGAKALVER